MSSRRRRRRHGQDGPRSRRPTGRRRAPRRWTPIEVARGRTRRSMRHSTEEKPTSRPARGAPARCPRRSNGRWRRRRSGRSCRRAVPSAPPPDRERRHRAVSSAGALCGHVPRASAEQLPDALAGVRGGAPRPRRRAHPATASALPEAVAAVGGAGRRARPLPDDDQYLVDEPRRACRAGASGIGPAISGGADAFSALSASAAYTAPALPASRCSCWLPPTRCSEFDGQRLVDERRGDRPMRAPRPSSWGLARGDHLRHP